MRFSLRAAAFLGYVAHLVDRSVGWLFGFLPFRVPGALIAVGMLVLGAWATAQATTEAIASLPQPMPTTVSALVTGDANGWVEVSGYLSGPHLDSSVYADPGVHYLRVVDEPHDHQVAYGGEPLVEPGWRRQTIFPLEYGGGITRWFYVLRDGDVETDAVVVRSARDSATIRTRSLQVAAAGLVDELPLLVETGSAAGTDATSPIRDVRGDGVATIRAAFDDPARIACSTGPACRDGWLWRYRVSDESDPETAAWVDSPHPPDAFPVALRGVTTADAMRMRIVLAEASMRSALDGLRHPTSAVLADGAGPVLPTASYAMPAALGGIAGVIILSWFVGYPVFRRDRMPNGLRELRPVVGEMIGAELSGRLAGAGSRRTVGVSSRIGWLSEREFARQAWHLHHTVSQPADPRPRLALLALDNNLAIPLEPVRSLLRVTRGTVATTSGLMPGLRLQGPGTDAVLMFGSHVDRDRVEFELHPSTTVPEVGPLPEAVARQAVPDPTWAAPLTVAALGAGALAGTLGAFGGVVSGDASPIGVALALLASAMIASLAAGTHRRRPLALEMLPSVALVGVVVGGVLAAASAGCGSWLAPSFDACAAFSPTRIAIPLVLIAAFSVSLWAGHHVSRIETARTRPRTDSR